MVGLVYIYVYNAICLCSLHTGSTDVIALLEGLLEPPEELAVLYPGCSADTNVVLNVAHSSLFNVTMVSLKFMITTLITCSWVTL